MANTSRQARLDRLLKGKARPQVPTAKDEPPIWEKELLESKVQYLSVAPTEFMNDAIEKNVSPSNEIIEKQQTQTSPTLPQTRSLLPGTDPNQIVYLTGGRREGGTPAELDENDDEYDSDTEPASSGHDLVGRYCVFSKVIKFPYKYMQDPESKVSRRFFAGERIFHRNWNLSYIFSSDSSKPLILVPLEQVQELLKEIGEEFQIDVPVPAYPFQISFYQDGLPLPTFMGVVNSKSDMTELQSSIAFAPANHGALPPDASPSQIRDCDAWNEKIDRALGSERKRKARKRRAERRFEMRFREGSDALKRLQRYLGLSQGPSAVQAVERNPSESQASEDGRKNSDIGIPALNVSVPAPFPFKDDTIIISIDVESWELDHSAITEIGVSALDTADIKNIAPGHQGEEWIKQIRSRHFRIKERESLRNFRFCKGDPEVFLFGASEFVALEHAPKVVDSCFDFPYLAGYQCEGPRPKGGGVYSRREISADSISSEVSEDIAPRNLLFIGHGLDGDVNYLSALGSSIFGRESKSMQENGTRLRQRVLSSIKEYFDTAVLHKALCNEAQPASLTRVCTDLDITPAFMHNAGNDARYTLEVFVKTAIRSRQMDDDPGARRPREDGFVASHAQQQEQEEQNPQQEPEIVQEVVNIKTDQGSLVVDAASGSILGQQPAVRFIGPPLPGDESDEDVSGEEYDSDEYPY